jgi:pSer/pThr/pTyr-binding forkhead associated (FHA) protein
MAQLILTMPTGKTQQMAVKAPSTTIGRSLDNDVVLESVLASRRHAVLQSEGPFVTLRDVGSRNGTYVNGARVEMQVLAHGDTIGIGDCRIRFLTTDQETVSPESVKLLTGRGILT